MTIATRQPRRRSFLAAGLDPDTAEDGALAPFANVAYTGDDRNAWHLRTIETLPGYDFTNYANPQNTFIVTYTNGSGQMMLQLHKQGDHRDPAAATTLSASFTQYDEQGNAILSASGSAITGYSESYADLLNCVGGNYQYLADGAGLYHVSEYYASTTASPSVAGGVENYLYRSGVKNGETGSIIWQSSTTYIAHTWTPATGSDITTYPVAAQTTYPNIDGTGALTTTYSYTWRVVDNVVTGSMASQTVTRPAVSGGHNGSGQAISETTVFDAAGRAVWRKDAEGFLSYSEFDAVTGALVKSIADVKISLGGYSNLPSGWTTPAGGGLHLVTTYELDGLGRTIAVTGPDNVTSYTVYLDYERQDGNAWILNETRSYPAWDPVTNHPTGPTIISREIIWNDPASTDVARYSESLSISAAPELDGNDRPDGTETFVMADIQSLSREYYNLGGQVTHGDVYHSRQDLTYSSGIDIGAAGVNRYRTTYSFNRRGWLKRTQGPDGTIQPG